MKTITITEAARLMSESPSMVRKRVKEGQLKTYRIEALGSRQFLSYSDVIAFKKPGHVRGGIRGLDRKELIGFAIDSFQKFVFQLMLEADRLDRAREDRRHAHELELEERRTKQEEAREEMMEKRAVERESQIAGRFKA